MKSNKFFIIVLIVSNLLVIGYTLYGQELFPQAEASFLGTMRGERLGYCLSPAGDVNGDGYDDFLIATFHYNAGPYDRGACCLVLGKPKNQFGQNVSADLVDARFIGDSEWDALGYEVHAGDINGDGYSDILMGQPAGHADNAIPGYAYVVFGQQDVNWGTFSVVNDYADITFSGESLYSLAGMSVSVVGDMDGDGCSELLIAAPYYDAPDGSEDNNRGRVYLIKGSTTWDANYGLAQSDAIFDINRNGTFLGYCVSGIGDINGDNIPDFAIGATGFNRVFVFYGRSEIDWGQGFSVYDADIIFTPEVYNGFLGWMIRPVGDINGDGYDDFMMSDYRYLSNLGVTYLVYGGNNLPTNVAVEGLESFVGENINDHAGYRFSGIGDFNHDGFDDFIIGALGYSNPWLRAGKVYLITGNNQGWQPHTNLRTIADYDLGESPDSVQYGQYVSGIGDINNDGGQDFAVASPFKDNSWRENAGKVYIYFGPPLDTISVRGHCSYYSDGANIESVALQISGHDTSVTTGQAGYYNYLVSSQENFQIIPSKSTSTSGAGVVSSYDAAMILRYIMGMETLSSAQITCADVDDDGAITILDAVHIARFVVNMPDLTGSRAGEWIFDPTSRSYSDLSSTQTEQDFTGYIMGDIAGGYSLGKSAKKQSAAYSATHLSFASNESALMISVADGSLLSADLEVEFEGTVPSNIVIEKNSDIADLSYQYQMIDNKLKLAVYGIEWIETDSWILKIKGLSLNPSDIKVIHYKTNAMSGWVQTQSLNFDVIPQSRTFHVLSSPNPFNSSVQLSIQLEQLSDIDIHIYDVNGRLVYRQALKQRSEGLHLFHWDGLDVLGNMTASGFYVCQIVTNQGQKRLKLVKLN